MTCGILRWKALRRRAGIRSTVPTRPSSQPISSILYLALRRFERGARWSNLSQTLQRDIRGLFGSHAAAQRAAEDLLLMIGKPGAIDEAVSAAGVGKVTPTALYIHVSALDQLPLLLRAFAGCGEGYLGQIDGANIIKLYRREPKLGSGDG